MLALVAVIGFSYALEVILVQPDWAAVAIGTLVPRLDGSGALLIAMGMLGATVMPHNLYLHSGVILSRRSDSTKENRRTTRLALIDSAVALNLAWLVNSAIVVMAAGAFLRRGWRSPRLRPRTRR